MRGKNRPFCSRGEVKYIQVAYTYLSTAFDMAASWLSRASPTLLMRKPNVCAKLIGRRLISSLSFHKLKRGGNLLSLTLCTYDTRKSEKSASLAITDYFVCIDFRRVRCAKPCVLPSSLLLLGKLWNARVQSEMVAFVQMELPPQHCWRHMDI